MKGRLDNILMADAVKTRLLEYFICRELRKYSPEIAHIFGRYALSAFREAENKGIAKVLDCGSTHPAFSQNMLKEEFSRLGMNFEKMSETEMAKRRTEFKECDWVIVPSKFVYDTLVENGVDQSKIIMIPYGVDVNRFKGRKVESGKFRLLFVGNNGIRKGVHHLLQAYSELNLPNSELIIVGRIYKEMLPFMRKYPGNYKFMGHVDEAEIRRLFLSSSAYVLPSLEEGSSLTTYEAMAAGLPQIISTNTGSWARDGKEGLIFPVRNIKALKEKIRYLYDNPSEAKRMGRSGRSFVKKFTWDAYGKGIISEYKRMFE
jgi:glycosyltransferase involved in cell wall biosynthesis